MFLTTQKLSQINNNCLVVDNCLFPNIPLVDGAFLAGGALVDKLYLDKNPKDYDIFFKDLESAKNQASLLLELGYNPTAVWGRYREIDVSMNPLKPNCNCDIFNSCNCIIDINIFWDTYSQYNKNGYDINSLNIEDSDVHNAELFTAIDFIKNNIKIQCIIKAFGNINDIINNFDISVCRIAYSKLQLKFGDGVINDLINNRMFVYTNNTSRKTSTLRRMYKYHLEKGFRLDDSNVEEVILASASEIKSRKEKGFNNCSGVQLEVDY